MPTDMHDIIADSLSDAELPLEEPSLDASPDDSDLQHVEEPTTTDSEPVVEAPVVETAEVQSPASRSAEPKSDDFEKRFGIPQNSPTGRENRIPYSRVKRITDKAEKDTESRVRAEYSPKVTEYETKVKDYESKISAYEGRLAEIAKFEHVLQNDAPQMLTILARLPQYQAYLRPLFESQQQQAPPPAQEPAVPADMPQPDQKLPDGTLVYSMEGLSKLNAWNRTQAATQARTEAMAEVEKKFGPIYQEWEQHRRVQSILPKVQAQISEARKWPMFNDSEADIVKALQADQSLSLEGAYRAIVFPKLQQAATSAQVDKDQLVKDARAQVMQELKKTPRTTSAAGGTTKPGGHTTFVPSVDGGDDKISSVIRAAIRDKA